MKSQNEKGEISVKVGISFNDWAKMVAYCRSAKPNEIMGLAHVRETEDGLVVYDPFILKQKVGPATCELDQRDFALFIGTYPDVSKLKCIWHSHVEMSAFFSSCDRGTSEQLARLGKMVSGSSSYFLSLVLNCREEYQGKVDMFKPFEMSLPIEVFRFHQTNLEIDQEVKEKLTSNAPMPHTGRKYYSQDDLSGWQGEIGEDWIMVGGPGKHMGEPEDDPEHDDIFDILEQVVSKQEKPKGTGNDGPSQSSP